MEAVAIREVCGLSRFADCAAPRVDRIWGPRGRSWLARLCLGAVAAVIATCASADNGIRTPLGPQAKACLPFDMPSTDAFFTSPKRVFAHYFNRFPLSFDNRDARVDYYAREYLNPDGEKGKWLANGGFLRSRPLPVPVGDSAGYVVENLKREVRLAISRGITGFTFDILSLEDIQPRSYLPNMLKAAAEVDSRFKIVLMPDIAALGPDIDSIRTIVKSLYKEPGLFRLADGRLVVSPFLSEEVSPEVWQAFESEVRQEGLSIALVPTFLSIKYLAKYRNVGSGFGTFGTPLPGEGYSIELGARASRIEGKIFMAGISGQGYRPKEYRYWEAKGSLAYRKSWLGAIEGGADWIQLTTWNDFSESTQVSPYTDTAGSSGTGYFNLTGFYASWFSSGTMPAITHDVLYYFYRRHSIHAVAAKAGQQDKNAVFWSQGTDLIEMVGFLERPGTLAISIAGTRYTKDVGAGVQLFSVPLGIGTPSFALLRDDRAVISFEGNTPIVGESDLPNGYSDLTYWSGSASAHGTCFSDAIWFGR